MFKYTEKLIETDRLFLRLFTAEDAEKVAKLCNNYNIYKSTLNLPYPYTADCATSWIETHSENFHAEARYEFAISDKQSGELYGSICLSNDKTHKNGEIGYWLGEEYWGRGYATEAAAAMIAFAFNEKGYHRVYGCHFATNPASGKVMVKAGMIYEGTQKEQIYKLDKFEDLLLYGIINPLCYCANGGSQASV